MAIVSVSTSIVSIQTNSYTLHRWVANAVVDSNWELLEHKCLDSSAFNPSCLNDVRDSILTSVHICFCSSRVNSILVREVANDSTSNSEFIRLDTSRQTVSSLRVTVSNRETTTVVYYINCSVTRFISRPNLTSDVHIRRIGKQVRRLTTS